jgi:hypothetical protein
MKKKARAKMPRRAKNPRNVTTRPAHVRTEKTGDRAKVNRGVPASKPDEYRPEDVIKTNGAMELDPRLLRMASAREIAKSLKRSADRSKHLESSPFHSAMSMLNVLISHVEMQKARLDAAKKELRKVYGEVDEKPEVQEPTTPVEYARQQSSPKNNARPRNGGKRGTNRLG